MDESFQNFQGWKIVHCRKKIGNSREILYGIVIVEYGISGDGGDVSLWVLNQKRFGTINSASDSGLGVRRQDKGCWGAVKTERAVENKQLNRD